MMAAGWHALPCHRSKHDPHPQEGDLWRSQKGWARELATAYCLLA